MAGSYFLSGPLPFPGGGNTVKITEFTSNGTWTKDANSQYVFVRVFNGGGGGGSGARGLSTASGGGGGGSGGSSFFWGCYADQLGATEPVVVGAGGTGGAAVLVDNTNGNDGNPGGVSSFAGYSIDNNTGGGFNNGTGGTAFGGGAGGNIPQFIPFDVNSNTGIISGPQGGDGGLTDGNAGADIGNAQTGSEIREMVGCAGGGGSGADAVAERTGGNGSSWLNFGINGGVLIQGGAGGVESGTIDGANGVDFASGLRFLSGSGGGGGGGQSVGAVAGNGGNGGFPSGGGGGGGASINGTASGAGGDGADGWVIVYEILGAQSWQVRIIFPIQFP